MNRLDIDTMLKLFAQVQRETEKHALRFTDQQMTYSNLVSIKFRAGGFDLYSYIFEVRKLIWQLPCYKDLCKLVGEWHAECSRSANPSSHLELNPELAALFTEEDLEDSRDHDYSSLGMWLTASGFFRQKLLGSDTEDWSDRFRQSIELLPNQLDHFYCLLAVDPLICGEFPIGSATLLGPENEKCRVLDHLIDYQLLGNDQSVFYDWVSEAENIDWKQFHHIYKLQQLPPTRSSSRDIEARDIPRMVFELETLALQLSCPWCLNFPNSFLLSSSGTDSGVHYPIKISRTSSSDSFWWDVVGDHDAYIESLKEHTIPPDGQKEFVALTAKTLSLLRKHSKRMGNSMKLFNQACVESNHVTRYLLMIVALEALLLGKDTAELKEKFRVRFARLLSPESRRRQELFNIADALYIARNKLVHGGNPELANDPRKMETVAELSFEELRDYVRRAILIVLQILEELDQQSSPLALALRRPASKKVVDSKNLMDDLHQKLFDDALWDTIYEAVASAYLTDCGQNSVPFV